MSKNKHASDGIAEDIIRAICQFSASEAHLKTLIEKAEAELESGKIDVNDEKLVKEKIIRIENLEKQLEGVANIRRKMMLTLFEMYDGDKDMWCLVKHLGEGNMQIFEAYQSSDKDSRLHELWLESNKQFLMALSEFLGIEVTDCAACFADFLKAKEAK